MLTCNNVGKKYGSTFAVHDVNLEIMPGHIYALLGPNGSGKSTLMKMIDGITKPDFGTITLDSLPIGTETKNYIAYMPTEAFFFSYMTALDAGKFYQDFYSDFSMDIYLSHLNNMQLDPTQKISKMSSGMMAKCKVALTLARNAKIIMLDEPLNGIDLLARDSVMRTVIQSMNPYKTILVSSHLIDELEQFCDMAIFMRSGSVVLSGNCNSIRNQHQKSLIDLYREIYA